MAETNGAQAPQTSIILSSETKPLSLIPSSFSDIQIMSRTWADSALIPTTIRGKPSDVAIIIATGLEYGFSPMQSFRYIYIVEGKPALSADALLAVVLRRKDVCKYFYPTEMTAKQVTFKTQRVDAPEASTLTYTVEDAARAGLLGKPNWKLNQIGMLANRCKMTLAKAIYSDLLLGMPSVDELLDASEQARDVTPAEPPKARRTKAEPAPVAPAVTVVMNPAPAPVVETSARETTPAPAEYADLGAEPENDAAEPVGAEAAALLAQTASAKSMSDLDAVAKAVNKAKRAFADSEGRDGVSPAEFEKIKTAVGAKRAALGQG